MRDDKVAGIMRASMTLVALAAALVLLGLWITGPTRAASASPEATAPSAAGTEAAPTPAAVVVQKQDIVRFGEDITVPQGTQVPTVVAFGGDVVIDGRVADDGGIVAFGGDVTVNGAVGGEIVAFGGDVTVNGTVGGSLVAFGSRVRLGPASSIGAELSPDDAGIVMAGGSLERAPGARISGEIKTISQIDWGRALRWAGKGMLVSPAFGLSLFGWLVQTAFFLVLALVAAALMPGQLRAVQDRIAGRPWPSLGWGALVFFVAAPAVAVVLVISIVGILLVVPYVMFLLLAGFFVTTAVAAYLAQKVLTGFGSRENLMLAVTVGVVGTTIVSRIPVIGHMLLVVMTVFGVGAAALGVADWRRERRSIAAAQAAAAAAAAGAHPAATPAVPEQSVITPIVQTSPEPVEPSPAQDASPPMQGPEAPPSAPSSAPDQE